MNDKQIMLIEDNPDDRDLTIRALRKNNVLNPVTVASNGAEALTMLFGDDHRDQGNNPAHGYVRKPVTFSEFSEAVHTVGLFWLLLNQPPPDPPP
jgi:hypothetical protein